jgi:hypothetical protein
VLVISARWISVFCCGNNDAVSFVPKNTRKRCSHWEKIICAVKAHHGLTALNGFFVFWAICSCLRSIGGVARAVAPCADGVAVRKAGNETGIKAEGCVAVSGVKMPVP